MCALEYVLTGIIGRYNSLRFSGISTGIAQNCKSIVVSVCNSVVTSIVDILRRTSQQGLLSILK
jgi:hypothetical protein